MPDEKAIDFLPQLPRLQKGLDALGVHTPNGAEQLAEYGRLLLEQNQVMNLTAITDPDQVVDLHFLDSAALLTIGEDFHHKTLIDVGTGAGFPGLPLKILEPSLDLTLLDSLGKRVTWLSSVCEVLSLDNVTCVHARAEEQALKSGFRDSFDFAVSRAVASLELLSELCLPYCKGRGQIPGHEERGQRGGDRGSRPGHFQAGGPSPPPGGLHHSGHRGHPSGGGGGKSGSHPQGLSPPLGENAESAPIAGIFIALCTKND